MPKLELVPNAVLKACAPGVFQDWDMALKFFINKFYAVIYNEVVCKKDMGTRGDVCLSVQGVEVW
jgi:hypothetical protein